MSKRHRGFIENFRPRAATVELIERVQVVLAEYADHLPLTVRQIFYRLVGTSGGYEKTELAYKRLYEAIGKARRGALIEFDAIRDDGAVREDPFGYAGIESLMRRFDYIVNNYRFDRQIGQPVHTSAACEAAGMVPQLARVADPFGVPVLSGGGFDSITAMLLPRRSPTAIGRCGCCTSATTTRVGCTCSAPSIRRPRLPDQAQQKCAGHPRTGRYSARTCRALQSADSPGQDDGRPPVRGHRR
jgi:hypothetical protein